MITGPENISFFDESFLRDLARRTDTSEITDLLDKGVDLLDPEFQYLVARRCVQHALHEIEGVINMEIIPSTVEIFRRQVSDSTTGVLSERRMIVNTRSAGELAIFKMLVTLLEQMDDPEKFAKVPKTLDMFLHDV